MLHFLRPIPVDTPETFAAWCARTRQTPGAIRRFWQLLLSSALNDDLDRISMRYAGKVIRESFLASPRAGHMGVPQIPLSDLYSHAVDYIAGRGGTVHLRANVTAVEQTTSGWRLHTPEACYESQTVIAALSFQGMQQLLPLLPANPAATLLAQQLSTFEHSPITSVHLWFDREITELPNAVLLDSTYEWMYNVSKLQPGQHAGHYLELVVSNSKMLVPMARQAVLDDAVRELARFFPLVTQATLLKAAVVKEVRATFCVPPGIDRQRPGPLSPWPGIYLAGDWTATGWPATMEGAVRSGYLAAEAIDPTHRFLVPDLPATGLMRLLG
jgi:zeta-carotene desaturase